MTNTVEYYKLIKIDKMVDCSQKDLFFLDKAVGEAYKSDFNSSLRLGACIVLNKKKLYTGYNQKSRTQISKTNYHSLHAEIHALCNYMKMEHNVYSITNPSNKGSSTIYIARLMRNPNKPPFGNSKPCKRCQAFLHIHNIKLVKYTDIDLYTGEQVLITLEKQLP